MLHLGKWPFPEDVLQLLEHHRSRLSPKEFGAFLQDFNPYPTSIPDAFLSLPDCDVILLPSNQAGLHVSVIAEEGDGLSYPCQVLELMCYPIADKPGRKLGPKDFHPLVWCTLKIGVDMTDKPLLRPRGSDNFHVTFAMLGFSMKIKKK